MGTFHHNPLFHGDDVVFIAGGSGVAPAMSMIRDICDTGERRRFHLLYGSRSAEDIIFRDELSRIVEQNPMIAVRFVVGELLTAETISDMVGPLGERMVYVCGPQALYPYALGQLTSLRHPRRRVRFEANGAPSAPQTQPHWPNDLDPQQNVTVTVGSASFETPRGRPLLDALEDNGIRPQAACRSGECSLCRVRVVAGNVHQAEEALPRMSDSNAGFVHSCVAYPLTDVTVEI
jgi:ferredoxin-NADP reductase